MWYHGSPRTGLTLTHMILFVTQDMAVARAYALGKVAFASHVVGDQPTIYTLEFLSSKILDMRKLDHQNRYTVSRQAYNSRCEPDERLPKLTSEGFLGKSGFPGYGQSPVFKELFPTFDGIYVDEGSQGFSLAIFDPIKTSKILGSEIA